MTQISLPRYLSCFPNDPPPRNRGAHASQGFKAQSVGATAAFFWIFQPSLLQDSECLVHPIDSVAI